MERKKNRIIEFSFGVGKGSTHVINEKIYTDSTVNTYKETSNYRPAYFFYFQPSIGRRGKTFGWAFAFKTSTYSLSQPALVTTFLEPVYSFDFLFVW